MTLRNEYLEAAGGDVNFAAVKFAYALMQGDPFTFKQGYTRENAILATLDVFPEVHRQHLDQEVSEYGD